MSKIKKELLRFLVAGFSAVGTDILIYYILLNFLTPNISKGISFIGGTIVAYFINKYWTFEKKGKSYREIIKFATLYSITLGLNILTNELVMNSIKIVLIAFIIATVVSTVVNFIGQKWWVFRKEKK
jgi:putative flippase GtrA